LAIFIVNMMKNEFGILDASFKLCQLSTILKIHCDTTYLIEKGSEVICYKHFDLNRSLRMCSER
jgi:hypothetical protein